MSCVYTTGKQRLTTAARRKDKDSNQSHLGGNAEDLKIEVFAVPQEDLLRGMYAVSPWGSLLLFPC